MKKALALILAAVMLCGFAAAEFAQKNGKVVVGVSAELAPYEFYADDGAIIGFDVDLIELIALVLDYECEFVAVDNGRLFAALAEGRIDLAVSALAITEENQRKVLFSAPYLTDALRIVVSAESLISGDEDLAGRRVGVLAGSGAEAYVAAALPEVSAVPYTRLSDAMEDLAQGKIDAVITAGRAAQAYTEDGERLRVLDEILTQENYGIAAAFGNEALMEEVNVTLSTLEELGLRAALCDYWFGTEN